MILSIYCLVCSCFSRIKTRSFIICSSDPIASTSRWNINILQLPFSYACLVDAFRTFLHSSNFDTQYLQRNNWMFRSGPTFTASCTVALFEQPTASQILLLRHSSIISWLTGEIDIYYGLLDSLDCRVSSLRSGESCSFFILFCSIRS